FRHIDFVAVDAQRVMAILVFADNEIQNRLIQTRRGYEPGELERVANYLNAHFAGMPLGEIRSALVRDMRTARSERETARARTVELAGQVLAGDDGQRVVAGPNGLIGLQDLSALERLRDLFEAFSCTREILRLLQRTVDGPGVRILFGEETGLAP